LDYATDYFSEAQRALDQLLLLSATEAQVLLCEDAWRQVKKIAAPTSPSVVGSKKNFVDTSFS
jgi:hypothetical protein